MSIVLYDLSVPTFLQTVDALAGVLDRAVQHCEKTGRDPEDFVEIRLIDDMAPFHFQIEAARHHAVWGLERGENGRIQAPPALVGPVPFGDLQEMIARAKRSLEAFTPDEVNGWAGRPLRRRLMSCSVACAAATLPEEGPLVARDGAIVIFLSRVALGWFEKPRSSCPH